MVPLIIKPIYTRIFEQPTLILIGWMGKSKSTYLLETLKSFSCVLTGVCQRRNACIYILTLCQCLWPACTTANGSESSQPVEVGSLSDIIYELFFLHPFRGWRDFWTVEDPTKCVQIHYFWPNYILFISPTYRFPWNKGISRNLRYLLRWKLVWGRYNLTGHLVWVVWLDLPIVSSILVSLVQNFHGVCRQ